MNKTQLSTRRNMDTFISYEERMLRIEYNKQDELLKEGLWKLGGTLLYMKLDVMSDKELVKQYLYLTHFETKAITFKDEWIAKFQQRINAIL